MNNVAPPQNKSSAQIISIGFVIVLILLISFAFMAMHENRKHAELITDLYQHPFSVNVAVLEANGNIFSMHRYIPAPLEDAGFSWN